MRAYEAASRVLSYKNNIERLSAFINEKMTEALDAYDHTHAMLKVSVDIDPAAVRQTVWSKVPEVVEDAQRMLLGVRQQFAR